VEGGTVSSSAIGVVGRFFSSLSARDWDGLATVLGEGVVRIGPFGDRLDGRDAYLDFLEGTVPADYGNDVLRVVGSADGRAAFARVTEHLRYPEQELHLEEAYVFEVGDDGRIGRIEIFWQTPQDDPGGFGSAASDDSYASNARPEPDA